MQIPYLDKWSTLEQDYSSSLARATKALHDASLRLPIDDNVRVCICLYSSSFIRIILFCVTNNMKLESLLQADIKDLKEAFDSTINIFNSLSPCIQTFIPKVVIHLENQYNFFF